MGTSRERRGGWGGGADLTGRQVRSHFTRCPNRPTASDYVPDEGNYKVDRGITQLTIKLRMHLTELSMAV